MSRERGLGREGGENNGVRLLDVKVMIGDPWRSKDRSNRHQSLRPVWAPLENVEVPL